MRTSLVIVCTFLMLALSSGCSNEEREQEIKFTKYMLHGKQVYETSCANCHQKDGSGLKGIYPSLRGIYLSKNIKRSTCMILNGSDPESKALVRMPAMAKISPLELAALLTYTDNSWGKKTGMVSIDRAKPAIAQCR
jgi:mono/diheme cytochrome c family protein